MKTVWIVNHYATDPQETASGSRHFSLARGLIDSAWNPIIVAASTEHPSGRRRRGTGSGRVSDRTRDGVSFRFLRTPEYRGGVGRVLNMVVFTISLLLPGATRGLARPAVVIGSTVHPWAAWAASVIARRMQVPFVFEIRDLWPQTLIDMGKVSDRGVVSRALRHLERTLCGRASFIVTLLPFASEYLTSRGVPTEKIIWISNGTDAHDFDGELRESTDEFTFMYLGSIGRANGVGAIVDGFLEAASADDRLRLVVVGDGTERATIQRRAADSVQGNRISFEPPVPKALVPSLVARSDAMVINILDLDVYRYGVSMNKLFDYAASARPILMASGARNNLVRDADAGIVVAANDASEIGRAMRQMASSDAAEDRMRWAVNARKHVITNYDYRALARRLADVLDRSVREEGKKA